MRMSRTAIVPAAWASGMVALALCGTAVTRARHAHPSSGQHARAPSFVARDVNHVLSTGQSLSVGLGGWTTLTKTQPYGNLMLEPGVMSGGARSRRFVPLVEGDLLPGTPQPVETMSSAF